MIHIEIEFAKEVLDELPKEELPLDPFNKKAQHKKVRETINKCYDTHNLSTTIY